MLYSTARRIVRGMYDILDGSGSHLSKPSFQALKLRRTQKPEKKGVHVNAL